MMRILLLIAGIAALFVILAPYGSADKIACGIVLAFVVLQFMLRDTPGLTRRQFEGPTIIIAGGVGTYAAAASLACYLAA